LAITILARIVIRKEDFFFGGQLDPLKKVNTVEKINTVDLFLSIMAGNSATYCLMYLAFGIRKKIRKFYLLINSHIYMIDVMKAEL
jgi:hypothetical protein